MEVIEKEFRELREMIETFTDHFTKTTKEMSRDHDDKIVNHYMNFLKKKYKMFPRLQLAVHIILNSRKKIKTVNTTKNENSPEVNTRNTKLIMVAEIDD